MNEKLTLWIYTLSASDLSTPEAGFLPKNLFFASGGMPSLTRNPLRNCKTGRDVTLRCFICLSVSTLGTYTKTEAES